MNKKVVGKLLTDLHRHFSDDWDLVVEYIEDNKYSNSIDLKQCCSSAHLWTYASLAWELLKDEYPPNLYYQFHLSGLKVSPEGIVLNAKEFLEKWNNR